MLFEEEEMVEVVVNTYRARAAEIGDLAHNPHGAVGGEAGVFLRGLDEDERRCEPPQLPPTTPFEPSLTTRYTIVFRIAHESAKAMKQYMSERSTNKR